ncbi:MAG TPA: DUF3881 family protein [Blastocatellia bacterium]|nr:DUF3881 family protein [Blastocatellia bacterium]
MEEPRDTEPTDGAVMAELFDSIGFKVTDEDSYNLLVECVESNGARSHIQRGDAALHGRCWKLGGGLEVWSILFERGNEIYYADCRPAFRSRYVQAILPWELIEYDEDGEAIVRGCIFEGPDVVFELQNLTEINPTVFRESHLHVALAGLAYTARIDSISSKRAVDQNPHRFELADRLAGFAEDACENDYIISGRVLAWREIQNPVTESELVWIYVDATTIRLEILVNRRALGGQLRVGAPITATVWLQGHILEADEMSAHYEGVDREYETGDFWIKLRRDN